MNLLITGANGFIGKEVTKAFLDAGNNVFAIVTNEKDLNDIKCDRLNVYKLFFDDYNKIPFLIKEPVDVIIHIAWQGLAGCEAKDFRIQQKNIEATESLLKAAKCLDVKKIVFASTMNTYELINLLTNSDSGNPRGTHIHVGYKIIASLLIRNFCFENHISYNEARIAMAYGEGNKSNMITNVFIKKLLKNEQPNLVAGNNQYDIIYVKDVATAFIAIVKSGKPSKVYYIGHSWNKTFKEIFSEIRDIVNPSLSLSFGAFPDDNLLDFDIVDRNELTRDTGWTPKIDFKESIVNTVEWIKDNLQ